MALRNATPLTFRARGVSDCVDATNVPPGMCSALTNLIPMPNTRDQWVPRPASVLLTNYGGFSTPANTEVLFAQGSRIYGMVQSARFAGKSEPFCYDTQASAFVTVNGVTNANTPTSTSNLGDWTPPTMDQVGGYVMATHPGFSIATAGFGWLDMTGFTSNTVTGNTHTSATLDTLSTNVLTLGWRPGMTIASSAGDLPAGCRIATIAAGGTSLTLSAAATGSNAGVTLTVAGGTFAAPLWAAGNFNENPIPAVATAVAQYAGSACLAVNTSISAAVIFSNAGDPLRETNAAVNQVITFLNAVPITALKPQGFFTLQGGVVQALLVFQGPSAIQQITGTPIIANSVATNTLSGSVGTLSPNSIAQTPDGILFIAPDGLRLINLSGQIGPVIGEGGDGVTTPFLFSVNPGRSCAAYNESVYRASVTNGSISGNPRQEWWYHLDQKRWSGPHTFPADVIVATQVPHGFAMAASGVTAKLWTATAYASLSATYSENGTQMTYLWATSLLPDTGSMSMNAMVETAIAMALPAQNNAQATLANETTAPLAAVQIQGPPAAASVWGSAVWGVSVWGAGQATYQQRKIPWDRPMVFKQAKVMLTGNCIGGLVIGNLYMKYQRLDYVLLAG